MRRGCPGKGIPEILRTGDGELAATVALKNALFGKEMGKLPDGCVLSVSGSCSLRLRGTMLRHKAAFNT